MEGKFWKGFVVLKWYFPCTFLSNARLMEKIGDSYFIPSSLEGYCLQPGRSKYGITLLLGAWWEMRRFPNVTFSIKSNKTYRMNNEIMSCTSKWEINFEFLSLYLYYLFTLVISNEVLHSKYKTWNVKIKRI